MSSKVMHALFPSCVDRACFKPCNRVVIKIKSNGILVPNLFGENSVHSRFCRRFYICGISVMFRPSAATLANAAPPAPATVFADVTWFDTDQIVVLAFPLAPAILPLAGESARSVWMRGRSQTTPGAPPPNLSQFSGTDIGQLSRRETGSRDLSAHTHLHPDLPGGLRDDLVGGRTGRWLGPGTRVKDLAITLTGGAAEGWGGVA